MLNRAPLRDFKSVVYYSLYPPFYCAQDAVERTLVPRQQKRAFFVMEVSMRKICLSFLVAPVVCAALLFITRPAVAQVPSIDDTIRVVDAAGGVGDTVMVDFYIRNVDTLGGYTVRMRYDPTLVEPLTDTVVDGGSTYYYVEASQQRGTAFEYFLGIAGQEPGIMKFVAAEQDLVDTNLFLPGGGVALQMLWRVKPSAIPQSTALVFENDPIFPQSYNTTTDVWGVIFKRPVLTSGVFTITGAACDCPYQTDGDEDGFVTSIDMGLLVDVLFAGRESIQDPNCLMPRFDLDCDGLVTSLDLSRMIDYLFAGGTPPCAPCSLR